ncbi:MAG TPA: LON peptidase substrate-binding domain-containing protein [Verrucomicrobiae bacterium]|nr:LON peptidase substrate-binding domain-containing protein [Verrucomicrobiae bacterium]
MERPARIPLFPLDVVLLPRMQFPLHIFEPRYKVMISRCLEEKIEFGMILAANNNVATMGCTAEILRKTKDYSDGRMDIATEGRAVFRLVDLLHEKEYYEGIVEYAKDELVTLDPAKERQLVIAFEQSQVLLFGRPWTDPSPNDPGTLAYRMAAMVPMEIEKRQTLLQTSSEQERREIVLDWLQAFVPKLAEQQSARRRAGGNGHPVN